MNGTGLDKIIMAGVACMVLAFVIGVVNSVLIWRLSSRIELTRKQAGDLACPCPLK